MRQPTWFTKVARGDNALQVVVFAVSGGGRKAPKDPRQPEGMIDAVDGLI